MGNKNTKFFDDLSKGATWSAGVAFKRSNPLPLDRYSVFESKTLAEEYATGNAVAYPGQIIAVVENGKMVAYVLAENSEGNALELQQIGIIPTGDGKTISVTDEGKISLLATGDTDAGSQLTLQADGTIKWVKPDTSTAEGQAAAIKALQDTVNGTDEKDGLVEKVGSAAEGETPSTGLYALIDAEIERATAAEEALDGRLDILETKEDKDTTYSIAEGEKILKLDGTVFSTVASLKYVEATETTNAKIQLLGKDEAVVSEIDASVFIKDGMLEDVDYNASTNTITFTWNTAAGTKTDSIELTDMLAPYTAGNGINIDGQSISAKVVADDKYLTVDTTGIHTKGIDDAIAAAEGRAASDAQSKANTAQANAIADADDKLAKKANSADVYTKDEIAGLNHATKTEVENAVKAEADIARAAEKANADAIDAIKDHEIVDSFADVVAELAKKQDKLTEGAYATESFVETKVKVATDAAAAADAKGAQGISDAAAAKAAADEAQADADTNALNIQEIEKTLNGYGEGEQKVDGLITKVSNNTSRIATLEGTVSDNTTNIGKAQAKANEAYEKAETNETNLGSLQQVVNGQGQSIQLNAQQIGQLDTKFTQLGQLVGENTSAAKAAQDKADEAYNLAGTKATIADVEAKGYATKNYVDGQFETTNGNVTKAQNRADAAYELADAAVTSGELSTALEPYAKTADIPAIKVNNAGNADTATTAEKVEHSLTIGSKSYNGSANVEVTASDLGLESAMHFVGAFGTEPTEGNNGDVYLNTTTKKEYVYSEGVWVELGDEGSYALRTITITGNNGLEGGGDLTSNRTIGIADNGVTTAKIADGNVTLNKLESSVQQKVNLGASAVQPGELGTMAKETATDYIKKTDAPGYDDILTKTVATEDYQAKFGDVTSDEYNRTVTVPMGVLTIGGSNGTVITGVAGPTTIKGSGVILEGVTSVKPSAAQMNYIMMNNATLKNLSDPTADQDAATKKYVDAYFTDLILDGGGANV